MKPSPVLGLCHGMPDTLQQKKLPDKLGELVLTPQAFPLSRFLQYNLILVSIMTRFYAS